MTSGNHDRFLVADDTYLNLVLSFGILVLTTSVVLLVGLKILIFPALLTSNVYAIKAEGVMKQFEISKEFDDLIKPDTREEDVRLLEEHLLDTEKQLTALESMNKLAEFDNTQLRKCHRALLFCTFLFAIGIGLTFFAIVLPFFDTVIYYMLSLKDQFGSTI